jgi:glycosidase
MKKLIAIIMVIALAVSVAGISVSAVQQDVSESGSTGITVHYYTEKGTPSVYYWNSLPTNISTTYPGPSMTSEGNNWYKYTFSGVTKINLQFVESDGTQGNELTRNTDSGNNEFWYKGSRWTTKQPTGSSDDYERTDLRESSIYFVITTRFYDGDSSNNVHCWDDGTANNPDTDKAWRGDFKGLIQKLDYIKALGFDAIWITPVVENASGYDYHGYHAFDFSKVDPRYESSDTDYQDLIDAAHEKGMKVIQDVVWNHTGNFGEATLAPMFTKDYSNLGSVDCMQTISGSEFANSYPNYDSLAAGYQYSARLSIMKNTDGQNHDKNNYYHHSGSLSWNGADIQTGQIAGDCVDINTENPTVANYITDSYMQYVDMGVDAFRLDTEKHISRWTLNSAYFPKFTSVKNFYIFGEVCARYWGVWNEGVQAISCPFYTWAETDSKWQSNWSTSDADANLTNSTTHFSNYTNSTNALTSDNAFLSGIKYHTPDYSKANGTGVIDFQMHWAFKEASNAYRQAIDSDKYYNDSTWNVTYVDSHDYAPDNNPEGVRYNQGTAAWAENLDLMFSFRGIPCIYYGSEIEFQKGQLIDVGTTAPLSTTGRAYFGDNIEGTVTATDFGQYTASGTVSETLNYSLAKHIRKLNQMRRAIPALQKGQYTTDSNYVSGGNMSYIRRYTGTMSNGESVDSLALVTVSSGATFKNIPNGTYIDAVTGDTKQVTNGTLTVGTLGQGNMRVYVCCASGYTGISGAIGDTNLTYLK